MTVLELRAILDRLEFLGYGDYRVVIPIKEIGNLDVTNAKVHPSSATIVLEHEEMN